MDKLKECALAFNNLLDKEYYITAGKKGNLIIFFVLYIYGTFAFLLCIGKCETSEVCSLKYF
jgi:hypothetical protein